MFTKKQYIERPIVLRTNNISDDHTQAMDYIAKILQNNYSRVIVFSLSHHTQFIFDDILNTALNLIHK